MGRWSAGVASVALLAMLMAAPAQATFPGGNGKIAYQFHKRDTIEIAIVNPDGSGWAQLTITGFNSQPRWSPDGQKIAFVSERDGNSNLYVMDPDGSNQIPLTDSQASDTHMEWSRDGTKIAFTSGRDGNTEIYVMDADGSNETRVTNYAAADTQPSWSPDGQKLVFVRNENPTFPFGERDIYTVNPDGSGLTLLTDDPNDEDSFLGGPSFRSDGSAWSPDGEKIAFHTSNSQYIRTMNPDGSDKRFIRIGDFRGWAPLSGRLLFDAFDGTSDTFTMNPDGTDVRRVTTDEINEEGQVWSPDGGHVAGQRGFCDEVCPEPKLFVVRSDGVGPLAEYARARYPDWQPVPLDTYARPKSAHPMWVSLVPAYEACIPPANNRIHGFPMAYSSCAPPQRTPGELTIGTPDANGQAAKSASTVRMTLLLGDPATPADEADLRLYGTINDVRVAGDPELGDYTGQLEVRMTLRITDKDNTPSPAATVADTPYSFPVPCTATADTTIGADCSFDTTAEAFIPGIAKERSRAIWELSPVEVLDGAGNVFMRQGVFVP